MPESRHPSHLPALHAAAIVAGLVLALSSCRSEKDRAVRELERRSIPATPGALSDAVRRNDLHLIPLFQTAGIGVAAPAPGSLSILQEAASTGRWEAVLELLPLTTPDILNHAAPDGAVLLDSAVGEGRIDVASALLDAGADPARARGGGTGLLEASEAAPTLFARLAGMYPPDHPALHAALRRAAESGNTGRLTLLLNHGVHPDAGGPSSGVPPLSLACRAPHADAVRELLAAGADVKHADSALPDAVRHNRADLCELLLAAGACPDQPGPGGCSALQLAVEAGRIDLTDLLLRHGGRAAAWLDAAFAFPGHELLGVLLQHGLSPDAAVESGDPLLIHAIASGREDLVPFLLECGADPDRPGRDGQTPFILAAIHRSLTAMQALLDSGTDPNQVFVAPVADSVIEAVDSEHFRKWLRRDQNLTPLMLAAARGDTGMLRLLLDNGAKRGRQTKNWHRYAINFACDTENIPAAQILLGRKPETETTRRNVVISLSRQRAWLYQDDRLVRSSRVSTGRSRTPTPKGSFVITDKQSHWVSSIYDVPMPYFMRLSCRDFGLHQGVVPGYPASHGCIRMPKEDAIAFFRALRIGDPVTIEP